MTIYKVNVKTMFYVDAESFADAKAIADKAIGNLPHPEYSIKATKKVKAEFDAYGDRA